MSLRDELAAVPSRTSGCKLCAYISGLEPAAQAEWHEALAMSVQEVPNHMVLKALRKRSVVLDDSSVRRHRSNHERS